MHGWISRRLSEPPGKLERVFFGALKPSPAALKDVAMEHWLSWLQWPAMLVTVTAAWFVASTSRTRRNVGFWLFLSSNVLWIAWGLHSAAHALVVLQFALAAMNIRGAMKSD